MRSRQSIIKRVHVTVLWLVLIFSALFIASCATTQNFEAVINTWLGQSEDNLVSRFGSPERTYKLSDSKKMLTYVFHGSTLYNYYGYGVGESITQTCEVSFLVEDEKVISYSYKGNSCKAKIPANEKLATRPYIGVYLDKNTVKAVRPGYPADQAGIRVGSTILTIDGVSVSSSEEIGRALSKHAIGEAVHLRIKDEGNEEDLTLHLTSETFMVPR